MKIVSRLTNINKVNANGRIYSEEAINAMCSKAVPVIMIDENFNGENVNILDNLSKVGKNLGTASIDRVGNDLIIVAEIDKFPKNYSLNIAGVAHSQIVNGGRDYN